jgi:hypothetical protein
MVLTLLLREVGIALSMCRESAYKCRELVSVCRELKSLSFNKAKE